MGDNRISKIVEARMESGEIIGQKCWQYVKEVNAAKPEILDLAALEDCSGAYTYRQMYDMWERYARVFSALGLTEGRGVRVGLDGTPCAESVFAFFGLNMTGASAAMIELSSENRLKNLKRVISQDHITDLILTDYEADAWFLRQLLKEKDSMGINNIIIMHVPVEGDFAFPWEEIGSRINHRRLREVSGAVFMEDLLKEYSDHDICYAKKACDEAAVVAHSSGTTEGVPKPVPLSDRGINESLRRHTMQRKMKFSENRMTTLQVMSMISASSFINMMSPLANGGTLVALPTLDPFVRMLPVAEHYRATRLVLFSAWLDLNMLIPVRPDLSSVDTVMLVGAYTSKDAIRKCREYMERCGSNADVLVGYGLAEAGVGLTLTAPDSGDDSVGYLLPGIKAKLWDEDRECFHEIDGKEHTGVLFVSTPSVSCGRLDDKVLFELDEIDGEQYLNTHDLFRVSEDGALYCMGRMSKFFMNSEGVRFEAGLVERAVSAQKGIKSCALAPDYNKKIHDTVPVLYVETERPGIRGYRIVREALEKAYITEGLIKKTALPVRCVLTDDIPRNATGKVDVHQIREKGVSGFTCEVEGVYADEELKEINLKPACSGFDGMACDCMA